MTQKEIAKEAGVSISTVSRVINNKGKNVASQEIQDRIWEIVRRTNYVPNDIAQKLRSSQETKAEKTFGSIECFFARMPFSDKDQFFSDLARSIETEVLKLNHVLKYSFTASTLQRSYNQKLLAESSAKGIMILGRCDNAALILLKKHFKNLCFVGLNSYKKEFDSILCDGSEASKDAVNYLIGLGHTRIGYIGETFNEVRYVGYRTAMIENKLPTESRYVADVILTYEGGYIGAKKLLESAPNITAVFCANDISAVGAMRAFQEAGLSIPNDISVIGIDDIEVSKYLIPPLTTIHIPIEEMGNIAAKVLIDRINGGHKIPLRVVLPFHLEVRGSCKKPSSTSRRHK